MKDRIPTKPGRMKLTDEVTGVVSYVIAEMADEPVETGTDINKANLLTDATASAISAGFGSTPDTPNDAFALLAGCAKIEVISYTGNGTYGASNPTVLAFNNEPIAIMISQRQSYSVNAFKNTIWLDWKAIKDAWANKGSLTYAVFKTHYNGTDYDVRYQLDGNTLSMWSTQSSGVQYNDTTANGNAYYVVSIYV